jgi:hypothetical protein
MRTSGRAGSLVILTRLVFLRISLLPIGGRSLGRLHIYDDVGEVEHDNSAIRKSEYTALRTT